MSIARPFIRLDATFFDDAKVEELEEGAQLLYIAMLCKAAILRSDGVLTGLQVSRLPIAEAGRHLDALAQAGLVERVDDKTWAIPNYTKWQKTQAEYQKEAERARVRRTSGVRTADVQSTYNGYPENVHDKKRKDKEKKESEKRAVAPTLTVVGDDAKPADPAAIAEILKANGLRRAAE